LDTEFTHWVHDFAGTVYQITRTNATGVGSLWSLSGTTWTKVCNLPSIAYYYIYFHLTDDGTNLYLSGDGNVSTPGIYVLSGGSFSSISTTRQGAVGFGGKLWTSAAYWNGSTWTTFSIGGVPYSAFFDFSFVLYSGSYYVINSRHQYSGDLNDISDGTNAKSTVPPGTISGDTHLLAQGTKIYILDKKADATNGKCWEYDLPGQAPTW
jgi:hypothetical protein